METQLEGLQGIEFEGDTQGTPFSESEDRSKTLTALKLQMDAEVGVIKRKLGSLKSFSATHALKQRDIARLMMVDPSAVHRWFKDEEKTPHYAWRILDFYEALELAPDRDVTRRLRRQIEDLQIEVTKLSDQIHLKNPLKTQIFDANATDFLELLWKFRLQVVSGLGLVVFGFALARSLSS